MNNKLEFDVFLCHNSQDKPEVIEIAQQLNIATFTVKSHVHNILEKLTLSTRLQIAAFAHDEQSQKSDS